jgi:3-methyl-2-oxobutanoate hydroxymethyltransferase
VQRDHDQLLLDAKAAEGAGAFAMVIECVPSSIAREISASVNIPTIGIGAGADCDGQVLVINDLVGLTSGYVPKFVKPYADIKHTISDAATRFRDDVRSGEFPSAEQQFK